MRPTTNPTAAEPTARLSGLRPAVSLTRPTVLPLGIVREAVLVTASRAPVTFLHGLLLLVDVRASRGAD
jgi:hypothetical protein